MKDDYIKRKTSTIPFGYEESEDEGYLKPIPEQIETLKVAEDLVVGESEDSEDMLEDEFGGAVALLKGRAWGFHSYRINYINQIIRSADIDTAAKIIGHKNISTTLIYFRKLKTKESVITGIINNAHF